ncbi:ThiF family adenylyltransferase [Mycolicibacterium goodii]
MRKLLHFESVRYILVRYRRGTRQAALVLDSPTSRDGIPTLRACESADESLTTRTLRTGRAASSFEDSKVAIVGCGAVGSHIADVLFRSGVRRLTLVDAERLRPGNIIRHTADNAFIGLWKPDAVKAQLRGTGLPTADVHSKISRVADPSDALALARSHELIVDATADSGATSVLRWATEQTGTSLVSVCVQRDGGIARVDRFPLRPDESHLRAVPTAARQGEVRYEQGCGSPVSMTPPLSVIMAASIGCQVILDVLTGTRHLPATIIEVLDPQPDAPYSAVGTLRS